MGAEGAGEVEVVVAAGNKELMPKESDDVTH